MLWSVVAGLFSTVRGERHERLCTIYSSTMYVISRSRGWDVVVVAQPHTYCCRLQVHVRVISNSVCWMCCTLQWCRESDEVRRYFYVFTFSLSLAPSLPFTHYSSSSSSSHRHTFDTPTVAKGYQDIIQQIQIK